jgi:hypothetical protein
MTLSFEFSFVGFGMEGKPAPNVRLGLLRVWLFSGTVFSEIARLKDALTKDGEKRK